MLSRRDKLWTMRKMDLDVVAERYGIKTKGVDQEQIIEQILVAEGVTEPPEPMPEGVSDTKTVPEVLPEGVNDCLGIKYRKMR